MFENLDRLRIVFWTFAAGVVALYVYGLVLGVYSLLELGLLSFVCLALLIGFVVHEVRTRRQISSDRSSEHHDRERRGW